MLLLIASPVRANGTWKSNPVDNDWNTAANWTPEKVPGDGDIATFDTSTVTGLTISTYTLVAGLSFTANAEPYTFTASPGNVLELGVSGIVNNSTATQTFLATVDDTGLSGASPLHYCFGHAWAEYSVHRAGAPREPSGNAGDVEFDGYGVAVSAGSALIINEGGATEGSIGGYTRFFGFAAAGSATIMCNGGSTSGAGGGSIQFLGPTSRGGNATLIANGGSNGGDGGEILFYDNSTGDTARVEVFGNGLLSFSKADKDVSIGSVEGDGSVLLGKRSFTIGGDNLSTTFLGDSRWNYWPRCRHQGRNRSPYFERCQYLCAPDDRECRDPGRE